MVRSGLTISNQDRLRRYNEERRQEERNDVVQQSELYGYLAEENKLDAQATSLARLAKNVFKKSFDIPKAIEPAIIKEIAKTKITLLDAIKQGKLDELVKSIIAIPANQLNARQRIIQKDLKNPEFKKTVNETIMEEVAAGKTPEEIDDSLKELVAGSEGKADLEDMAAKAQEGGVGEAQEGGVGEVKPSAGEVAFTIKQTEGTENKPIEYSDLTSQIGKFSADNKLEQLLQLIKDNNLTVDYTENPNYKQLLSVFKTAMSKYNLVKNTPVDKMEQIRKKTEKYRKFIL